MFRHGIPMLRRHLLPSGAARRGISSLARRPFEPPRITLTGPSPSAARRALTPSRRQCSSGNTPPPEEAEALWPLYGGCALVVGSVLATLVFRREGTLQRLSACVRSAHTSALNTDDMGMRTIGGIVLAFALAQLPVEEIKLKLLRLGALGDWGNLLGLFDLDQQQIALFALVSLLDGEAALEAFQREDQWYAMHKEGKAVSWLVIASISAGYEQIVTSLPALLHGGERTLGDPELLLELLRLCLTLVRHPAFPRTNTDDWIWERLLDKTAEHLFWEPSAALPWVCIAAGCADRTELGEAMLRNDSIKRMLVSLAEFEPSAHDEAFELEMEPSPPVEASSFTASLLERVLTENEAVLDTERQYARLALHRLAVLANATDTSNWTEEEKEAWQESFFDDFLHYAPDSLPAFPASPTSLPEERLLAHALSLGTAVVGGLVYGAVRGSLASSRARRSVARSIVATVAGSALFEAFMLLRVYLVHQEPPPQYGTLARYAMHQTAALFGSCLLLQPIVQPHRAPFAFGGWLLGRAIYLSQDLVEFDLQVVD